MIAGIKKRTPSLLPRLMQLLREEENMVPTYFSAAAELGNPLLLPVVEEAAAFWRKDLRPGEEMNSYITSALESLQKAKESADQAL